jgi:hypothetical protein
LGVALQGGSPLAHLGHQGRLGVGRQGGSRQGAVVGGADRRSCLRPSQTPTLTIATVVNKDTETR